MRGSVRSIRQARQVREIFASVMERLDDVEDFLAKELARAQPAVREVAGYVLSSGGKRLRPALVLLVSKMLSYSGERDVRYGAVIELIHTATLIHDDIIDQSDLRRGRPTANHRWGNQATVLVGDWLYARTMDLCLELGDVEVMRRLTHATLQMTEGEILAERARGSTLVDEGLYLDITRRKTAELFAAACAIPALFQASTLHLTETLLEFGSNLGMCFQLIDDLLDYSSSRSELGKPVMADLREGRMTLPVILLWPRLDQDQRDRIADVLSSGAFDAIGESELLEKLRMSGVFDQVRERAQRYSKAAIKNARTLPPGGEREALIRAAGLLLERQA